MSNTIKLTDFLPGEGVFNKTVNFKSPLRLPASEVRIKIAQVKITDRIPNVFDSRVFGVNFFNTTMRIGTDLHGWSIVRFPTGLYLDAEMIGAALNNVINSLGWWTNIASPGITFSTNSIIDRIVITIDSTKLNPLHGTQIWLEFTEALLGGSKLWYTLGYTDTTRFTVDGVYTSPSVPMLDTQGTSCIVCCSIMPPRIVNDIFVPYVADVSFAGKLTPSENVWPPGNVANDDIVYQGPRTILQATFYVLTEEGRPMFFMGGRLTIEFLFY
jgi:hypothetical protein